MSYARWGEEGSDVYVIAQMDGFLTCYCENNGEDFPIFRTCEGMIAHLREHQDKGDVVPERTFKRLEAEAKDGLGSHNPLKDFLVDYRED